MSSSYRYADIAAVMKIHRYLVEKQRMGVLELLWPGEHEWCFTLHVGTARGVVLPWIDTTLKELKARAEGHIKRSVARVYGCRELLVNVVGREQIVVVIERVMRCDDDSLGPGLRFVGEV